MQSFEPLINLLVLLSALSIAAERLTNVWKLRFHTWHLTPATSEKEWERHVGQQALLVSVLLAIAVKADFFAILSHLEAPWETLGWAAGPSPSSPWALASAIAGSVLTGVSLGFGSKFWHDVLDIVYGARTRIRNATGRIT